MKKLCPGNILRATIVLSFVVSSSLLASPHYYVYRTSGPISIDGVMNEPSWQDISWIPFFGIADGSQPPYRSRAKMLWDSNGIYVGLEFEEPNVWATLAPGTEQPEDSAKKEVLQVRMIMLNDPFLKVFLDPDADGRNYLEFHINALNHVNNLRVGEFQYNKGGRGYWEWSCTGMKSAVRVDGTVNDASDKDKGWSTEVFIPWKSLKEFTEGHCPPSPGDVWRAHMGRTFRRERGGDRSYATWPVMGKENCHLLDRYAYIRFSEEQAVRKKLPGPNPLQLKLAWEWSMRTSSDTEIVATAKSLGFNALQSRRESIIPVCKKEGLKVYGLINYRKIPREYAQVLSDDDINRSKALKESPAGYLYQGGGEPVVGGETLRSSPHPCWNRPEVLEQAKKQVDELLAKGYDGIALDGIGYTNYYACFCPYCREHFQKYAEKTGLQKNQAMFKYYEDVLVSFCNELIRYAKKRKPAIMITCHVWPYFTPNPLYGNRMAFDYCGQTTAWFFYPHWDVDKMERCAYEIVRNQDAFFRKALASPFIAVSASPARDVKSPERIREEIRIVKQSGARAIQMAELGAIAGNPEIAAVVREELNEADPRQKRRLPMKKIREKASTP